MGKSLTQQLRQMEADGLVVDSDLGLAAVFNGCIYNYKELRAELEAAIGDRWARLRLAAAGVFVWSAATVACGLMLAVSLVLVVIAILPSIRKSRDEVFVGEVFHDLARRMAKRPFDPGTDVAPIEGSLTEAYGLPVKLKLDDGMARGSLKPIGITIRQAENGSVTIPGFVSADGASLLIGEFQPLSSDAQSVRRRLLAESAGIRPSKGDFYVTEFLDFQCERCRVRAPEVKKVVTERGGAVEVRLLPLTKVHDWAFAAENWARVAQWNMWAPGGPFAGGTNCGGS